MEYILTVVHATFNVGSVTEKLTFDSFYEMADYIGDNSEQWQSYHIAVV